ncbi:MAG: glycine cleavage system aminomethyltransferase GcvT [Candidatus Margulisiibacteriota bacterium]|jgi:aminomethyltransferase
MLKRTPLYEEHQKLNAKIVPFSGWELPIQYQGIIEETMYTRSKVSIFDTCHMGEFLFQGNAATSNLDYCFTIDLIKLPINKGKYGFILNDAGGVVDDVIVFRLAEDAYLIVVNAGTQDKDFELIKNSLKGDFIFKNLSVEFGKIDIQGPLAKEILLAVKMPVLDLKYFGIVTINFAGFPGYISRTGYTGEIGYEVYLPNTGIVKFWQEILQQKFVKPAGLGARDILRLEKGYSLYGHELTESITPFEAQLEKFVALDKDFRGKTSLMNKPQEKIKIAFEANSKRAPREGYKIFVNNNVIGFVSSGTYSPFLEKGIGMGYIDVLAQTNNLTVGNENLKIEVTVNDLPFLS